MHSSAQMCISAYGGMDCPPYDPTKIYNVGNENNVTHVDANLEIHTKSCNTHSCQRKSIHHLDGP